jgi:hypothetical protein
MAEGVHAEDGRFEAGPRAETETVIDCDNCVVRGIACDDCVIAVLLGGPPSDETEPFTVESAEIRAFDALATGGLLPPLRLSPRATRPDSP